MATSKLLGKRIKNTKEFAMPDSLLQCNCIASDSNKFKLLIKESLLIKSEKPVLNWTMHHFHYISLTKHLMFTFYEIWSVFHVQQ